jgi:predicted phage tail protein
MRIVKVYGPLAKFLGQRSFKFAVKSPAEAVRLLLANFPQLHSHMAEYDYKISVGRLQLPIAEDNNVLHYPTANNEAIRIIPVISGAGEGAGQILAGVGLIALSFLLPGAGIFGATSLFGQAAVAGGFFTGVGTVLSTVGLSLALTGVSQLLAPTTTLATGADSDFDPRKSYSFSGIQNVARQGVPVPIVYGEVLVGSIVVSAGIDITTV